MSFTGKELIVDPKTGYLTDSEGGVDAFDSKKKVLFVQRAQELWPKIGDICKSLGISRQTYYNHMATDSRFKADIDEIKESVCDDMEATMIEEGRKPKGFLDRMAILRAHRPQDFDPAKRVIVENYPSISSEQAQAMRQRVESAIDAEVIETVRRLRVTRGKANRPANQIPTPSTDSQSRRSVAENQKGVS